MQYRNRNFPGPGLANSDSFMPQQVDQYVTTMNPPNSTAVTLTYAFNAASTQCKYAHVVT